MALGTVVSMSAAIAALDAALLLLNTGGAGKIEIRSGAAPAKPETADSGTLLAEITLSADAFNDSADDSSKRAAATAKTMTADTSANNTGTAAHFRAKNGAGTVIIQGTVGLSGTDMTLNTVDIVSGATVTITSWTVRLPTGEP